MDKTNTNEDVRPFEETQDLSQHHSNKRMKTKDLPHTGMEEKSIAEGAPRVKFGCNWVGTISTLLSENPKIANHVRAVQEELADAMVELEEVGATPVCFDGKVGGNAAAVFDMDGDTYMLVSKSGKLANQRMDCDKDFCIIKSFNSEKWSGEYYACDDTVLPTSDSPLHFYGLWYISSHFNWSEYPKVVLHGHALETEEQAKKYNLAISVKETLFSTKEDSDALMELMEEYPYPKTKIYIRKGHGFLLFGKDVKDAVDMFRKHMKDHIIEEKQKK